MTNLIEKYSALRSFQLRKHIISFGGNKQNTIKSCNNFMQHKSATVDDDATVASLYSAACFTKNIPVKKQHGLAGRVAFLS